MRQQEPITADLVFPVLYYSREELLALCDVYIRTLDSCLSVDVLSSCKSNPAVTFVQSQMGYVCGANAVEMLENHDCISRSLTALPHCRTHITGLPLPELQAGKCRKMPAIFKCIQRDVYEACSTRGLTIIAKAIGSFGCDISKLELGKHAVL